MATDRKNLMRTRSRIVVGVDGSPASVAALRCVGRQADLPGSTLETIPSWEYPFQYGSHLLYIEDGNWGDLAGTTLDTAITEAGPTEVAAAAPVSSRSPRATS
jgi:hypothetical protein